jgi:uncharacterized protein YdeI (YjbR/CyaY-like superfamily)
MTPASALTFADAGEFDAWLCGAGATGREAWLVVARKGHPGLTADEAGDVAIGHGWIDSHRKGLNTTQFLQRYSPRRRGSPWSRVNVERAEALAREGRMRAGGRAQIAAAKADGRWAAAYERQSTAEVPPSLAGALAADPAAAVAFAALSRSARYALFLPLLKARTAATRASALRRALADLRPDAG